MLDYSASMPLYRFAIREGISHPLETSEEVHLADDEAARREALAVVDDLKKNSRREWIGRSIEVTEGDRQVCQITFD